MPCSFVETKIKGLIVVEPKVFGDERGFFLESYKYSEFSKNGIIEKFVQDNHSKSSANVLRGLHFQLNPKAQSKLVRAIKGKIIDVAVDLRKDSPTYLEHFKIELTEENKKMLYIPAGFAHGFLSLVDGTEIIYKCTEEYSPEYDCGIIYNDPAINVDWGRSHSDFIVSEKDLKLEKFDKTRKYF